MASKPRKEDRVLYISDVTPNQIRRLKRDLAKLEKKPDLIVHVGDLADSPLALLLTRGFYSLPAEHPWRQRFIHSGHFISNMPDLPMGERGWLAEPPFVAAEKGSRLEKFLSRNHLNPERIYNKITAEAQRQLNALLKVLEPYKNNTIIALGNVDTAGRNVFSSVRELEFEGFPPEQAARMVRPSKDRDWGLPGMLEAKGFRLFSLDKPLVKETTHTMHVLFGFPLLRKGVSDTQIARLAARVEKARAKGKKIVLVPHGTPFWPLHQYDPNRHSRFIEMILAGSADQIDDLPKEMQPNAENRAASETLQRLIIALKPDQVVHGHNAKPVRFLGLNKMQEGREETPGFNKRGFDFVPVRGRRGQNFFAFVSKGKLYPFVRDALVKSPGGFGRLVRKVPLPDDAHRLVVSFLPDGMATMAEFSRERRTFAPHSIVYPRWHLTTLGDRRRHPRRK
ncbi:hypothetical protein HY991_05520 [Candidatus Micrarchaeota archaeon]|nr:hypothetical protein [Candidatus Micrarchaeota archaeon]